jgi:excisionase family DNA binding protein
MSASAAAKYLGKHPATLSRWIADGKLTGEKVEGRFLLSPESVESMRESLAAPAQPVTPLPDRLAHLAGRTPAKSRRG